MRLIQKSRLYFQEGNSDKVYEVDLVDLNTADDSARYLVNFRYGRRGYSLREGTKTSSPVSLDRAQKLFDSIVVSKTNRGYRDSAASQPTPAPKTQSDNISYSGALLDRIRNEKHPDARARQVWRLPPEKNPEAAALIATLLGQREPLHEYTLLWTLGRVGTEEHIDLITPYLNHKNSTLSQLALEAILNLTPVASRNESYANLCSNHECITPDSLKRDVLVFNESDSKRATSNPISELLKRAYLKALVDKDVRQALLEVLPSILFKPGAFGGIRYLLKMSEFRLDVDVFSALNVRLENSRPHFNREWRTMYNEHGRLNVQKELESEHARLAHSQKTHRYLVSRFSRTFKRLGISQSEQFIALAEATLLQYSTYHARPSQTKPHYRWDENWRRQLIKTVHYDEYAHCNALNTLIRMHNSAYAKNYRGVWQVDPDASFSGRGELFPERWDKAPESLLRIALGTDVEPISNFAIRALKDNEAFLDKLSLNDVLGLFTKPFSRSQEFALDRLKQLLASQPITEGILVTLFNSGLAMPIAFGLELLGQKRDFDEMLAAIAHALCIDPDIELPNKISVLAWFSAPEQTSKIALIDQGCLLSTVMNVATEKDFVSKTHANLVFDWLMQHCEKALTTSDSPTLPNLNVAEALIQFHSNTLVLFGCRLLEALPVSYHHISDITLKTIHASTDEDIQAFSIRLLKKLRSEELTNKLDDLIGLLIQSNEHQQRAILSVFEQAIQSANYSSSSAKNRDAIFEHLVGLLHGKKLDDALQHQLTAFLRSHCSESLRSESSCENLWQLATARSEAVHTLVSEQFNHALSDSVFSPDRWLALLNSPTLALRENARDYFKRTPEALIVQMDGIVPFMESEWPDTQAFIFAFFRDSLPRDRWSPDQIVAVCDSVSEPVQAFGRELVQSHFEQGDAEQYLLQLSQHPAQNVELFVSQLLAQHAADNEAAILALQPYFVSVLSRVNTGRAAKDNVIRFFKSQSNISEAVRHMVSQLLTRVSLTSVQKDKAEYIKLMLSLKQNHTELTLPVSLKAIHNKTQSEIGE